MTKVLAIAQREIRERAFVFVAAAGLAAAPFLALLVRSGGLSDRIAATAMLGTILAVVYILALGGLLGVSLVGREMREKRLSFYFSRPVSGTEIWLGKLVAAAVLLTGSAAIIFAPPAMLVPREWRGVWDLSILPVARVVLLYAGAFLLIMHAVSSMIRSRSLLVIIDFVAAAGFAFGLATILMPFLDARVGLATASLFTRLIGGAIAAALIFGGAWQLSRGRVDAKRSHRELSLALWPGLVLVLILSAGAVMWFTSVTPADLKGRFYPEVIGDSSVVLRGTAPHRLDYTSAFLINVRNGAWVAVPRWIWSSGSVSDDGTVAVWARSPSPFTYVSWLIARRQRADLSFEVARLRGTTWETRDSGITATNERAAPFMVQLSPAGDRLAVLSANTLSLFDVASGHAIGSAHLEVPMNSKLSFAAPDSVIVCSDSFGRLEATRASGFEAYRFDARSRSLRHLVHIELAPSDNATGSLVRDGRSIVVMTYGPGRRTERWFDAVTGAERPRPAAQPAPRSLEKRGDHFFLLTAGSSAPIDLGQSVWTSVAGVLPDGRLVIEQQLSASNNPWDTAASRVLIVDPRTGNVRVAADRMYLLRWSFRRAAMLRESSVFAALTIDGDLVAWNAMTGERRSLLRR